jgi:hypothetical protein
MIAVRNACYSLLRSILIHFRISEQPILSFSRFVCTATMSSQPSAVVSAVVPVVGAEQPCATAKSGRLCPHANCLLHALTGWRNGFATGYTLRSAFTLAISLFSPRLWGKEAGQVQVRECVSMCNYLEICQLAVLSICLCVHRSGADGMLWR